MARRITYKFKNQPQQIEMTSKGSASVRNFRDQEFARMGFSDIYFIKE